MWCNIPPASEHSDAVGAGEHLEIGTLEIEMNIFETNLNIYESRILQGDFFNWASPENVSRLAPPNLLGLGLLNFLGVGIIFTSPDT